MSLTVENLTASMRFSIRAAAQAEPHSADARARFFVSNLAGMVHVDDKQLSAELFALLLAIRKVEDVQCAV